jgi:hypothetical protein
MKDLPRNVWLLTTSQALLFSVSSMVVFVGRLIGFELAPVENLSTRPVAGMLVGNALTILLKAQSYSDE